MSMAIVDDHDADDCRKALAEEQAASLAATGNWSHVDKDQVHRDWHDLYGELAGALPGARPDDPHIQELVDRHYAIACRFYTPSRQAYLGMALLYAEDAAMRDFHNAYHPEMVQFLGSAMRRYAETRL
ncbi:hypothetical protein BJY16_006957 [Actinoplanes octamycinicus]|uniref:TipAS antibiotic-recognition domain-containing protein n=1 Tax=Actinoplanes octamycinicus TaxID=135948 RepID=A0A7W7H3Z7_9ACTN|nr:TipAS antibiotic-recognition domain-containing protein [Actinoplanes octamycinicus]MBB4743498.1 hypothetical protein [Actinoplanes octamycinicus]GIE62516.1 hypothetical protein Aoc01nite_79180 [Actinoplanes octamycinicus]